MKKFFHESQIFCLLKKLNTQSLYPMTSALVLTFYNESLKVLMTSVYLSVCLSDRPHDNFRKYSLIATKLTHVNMCHPSMFPIKNRICSCYTFATGPFKINPIHYSQWAIFIGSEF